MSMNQYKYPEKLILALSHIDKNSLSVVGGKGANLGEMAKHEFPIPDGFSVTTHAYKLFLKESSFEEELIAALSPLDPTDPQEVSKVGKMIRDRLTSFPIPSTIEEGVSKELERFPEGSRFAIRSSATAEDLPDASFAGQQDTYLNIKSPREIMNKIRSCWASLFTDRAITYRIKHGYNHKDVLLSVVVQEMIPGEVSGILFTADPISGSRDIVSIDASYGLGEALVSGLVIPDLYKVRKSTSEIIEKGIGDKIMGIFPTPHEGTISRENSEEQRASQALSDERIWELTEVALKIESHYGAPQDIEWCLYKGKIYILQSRPITTLFPLPILNRRRG